MRRIADQVVMRLADCGASAFTVENLSMICWAYSNLKVRRCLNILPPLSWLSWTGMCMLGLKAPTAAS